MKKFILPVLVISLASLIKPKEKIPSTITPAKINWKSPIGNVSYRTNIAKKGDLIFIGSNGINYMDFNVLDKGNGVYALNSKNGKIMRNFQSNVIGDMDVNGILYYENSLYFGNDNDEFLCTDMKGNLKFRIPTSGDVEFEPLLLKIGNKNVIVYGTETGELRAINPKNGKTIWKHYDNDFQGWKKGENRTLFKVKMHFYSDAFFFDKPILMHIDDDAILDMVFAFKSGFIKAISGENGTELFSTNINKNNTDDFYCHLWKSPPLVLKEEKNIVFVIPYSKYLKTGSIYELRCFNINGDVLKKIPLDKESFYNVSNKRFTLRNKVILFNRGMVDFSDGIHNYKIKKITGLASSLANKYSFSNSIASKQLLDYNGELCMLLVYENGEQSNWSSIAIIGLNTGRCQKLINLPSTSEFEPIVGDFNKDKKADVLIGCHNGFLYNIDLQIPSSAIKK